MSRAPIPLSTDVPEPIRALVVERIEPVLEDVRLLLALPRTSGSAGFAAAAVPAMFSVLAGLSRVFFHATGGDRPAFAAVAERYPVASEPAHAIKEPKAFVEGLYAHYQASLVHGLGLPLKRDTRYEPWRCSTLRMGGRDLRLEVDRIRTLQGGDALVQALESQSGWPVGVGPTLSLTTGALRLEVDALYCGLRRLVLALASDPGLRQGAVALLEPWYAAFLRGEAERAAAILAAQPTARAAAAEPQRIPGRLCSQGSG